MNFAVLNFTVDFQQRLKGYLFTLDTALTLTLCERIEFFFVEVSSDTSNGSFQRFPYEYEL